MNSSRIYWQAAIRTARFISSVITKEDILESRERIAPYIHHTPVITSRSLDERAGRSVYLKCENFQKMGSFKMRGVCNFLSRLDKATLAKGVVTHSSGNHAQALAAAAQRFGVKAYVVMPETAPKVKQDATKACGAEVTLCENSAQARIDTAAGIEAETGATMVHPYDHDWTIMGQSTATAELLEAHSQLDAVLSPISGGGLASGTALAAHYFGKRIKVYAIEPELADDAYLSFQAGHVVAKDAGPTIADGLRAPVSERSLSILSEYGEGVVRVSDDEIREAMIFLWERCKIVVEPSGATSLAGLLFHGEAIEGDHVGVIVSGGNLDVRKALQL